ncbi:CPBP family intramembrane glutamic endopeptidase [Gracilibacillus suaedae]|uniref:CPBP family intramembrane glutamic endopeptidase n=1 Tax=Gracilibacillus suaedae TaxID=2820273 RepID=UPI001ABDD0B8|nr:CPBP family intramembrane glutamic endopeptidase [Gracilibacillus suaedae]
MKNRKALKRPLVSFVVTSYAIFFIFFIAIGIGIVLGVHESITSILQIIASWSSTFAFLILFKRIYPRLSLIDFVKQQFTSKIRFSVLCTVVIIQVIITTLAIFLTSITNENQGLAFSFTGLGLIFIAFLDNLVRGPLGEELGWRGYALNELQKQYSPLVSSIIVGVLWGLWHTPLWFASGYTGGNLIKYIVFFMIGILSISVIITLFYNLNRNLVIPIVIHQLFNFSLVIKEGDLLNILTYATTSYFVVAITLIVINPKEILYQKTRK